MQQSLPTLVKLLTVVEGEFNITSDKVLGRGRTAPVAHARQIAMYLARTTFGWTHAQIGRIFNRDHTCVEYAVNRIEDLRNVPYHNDQIERIEEILGKPRRAVPRYQGADQRQEQLVAG